MIKFTSHGPDEPHKAEFIEDGYFLRIDEGDFKDVEFSFKDIVPKEEDAEGNFHMDYDYNLWFAPQLDPELTLKDFHIVTEDILRQIMNEIVEQLGEDALESPEAVLESPEGIQFQEHEIIQEEV